MISFSKYDKLYESLDELTQMYSKLVEIAKKFEQMLGADDLATTNLMDAISKLNELILAYNPSSDELVDSPIQNLTDTSDMENQDFDNFDAQSQEAQNQEAQNQEAQNQEAQNQDVQDFDNFDLQGQDAEDENQ